MPGIHVSSPMRVLGICCFSFCSTGFPKGPWLGNMKRGKKNNPDLNRFKSCCLCMPRERPQASNADQLPVAWLSRKKVWAAGCRAQLLSFGRPPGPQTRVQRLRPLWQGHCCRFRQAAWGCLSTAIPLSGTQGLREHTVKPTQH